MTTTTSRYGTIALSVLLLVGAVTLYAKIPRLTDSYAPLAVHGTPDGQTRGRNDAISIIGVYSAPVITYVSASGLDDYVAKTHGRWIVVEIEYERLKTVQSHIMYLQADNRKIKAERSPAKYFNQPGLPEHMTLVFDVPAPPRSLTLIVRNLPGGKVVDVNTYRGWGIDSQLEIDIPVSSVIARPILHVDDGKLTT